MERVPSLVGVALLDTANVFTASQTIDLGSGALPAGVNGNRWLTTALADATPLVWEHFTYGITNGMIIRGRNTGGTRATPTATADASRFFFFAAHPYDGSSWYSSPNGSWSCQQDGIASGSNRGVKQVWSGTLNGATSPATWMWLQGGASDPSGTLGIGAAPTTGNGLLQLASGTTRANGIAFGTDAFLYRTSAGSINFASASGPTQFYTYDSTGTYAAQMYASSSNIVIGGVGNAPLILRSNSITALTVDTSQNCTFAGNVGFNGTTAIAKPTITGSRGGNAALASLLTALASYGLITDSTTA